MFDLIVIGGGSGGVATANKASTLGASVAIIEADRYGGTCVNRGCVPKKVMWYAANIAQVLHGIAQDYGFKIGVEGFSWETLVEKREAYLHRLNNLYANNLTKNNITRIEGRAQFVDANTVQVGDKNYQAKRILIAVGGVPLVPAVPGADLGVSSDGFFELTTQPKRVCVIGSGYIGVEIAGVLNALGSDVTIVARGPCVLRNFERSISLALMQQMQDDGVHFVVKQNVQSLSQTDTGINVHCEPSTLEVVRAECCEHETAVEEGELLQGFDTVIWAVGRKPNTANLNLAAAGIECDARGYIPVDKFQQTKVDSILAVGDVTPNIQLTPVAIAAGRRLAMRLYDGQTDLYLNYNDIPSVVFSHPALASVGLTERQAQLEFGVDTVESFESHFAPMFYAMSEHKVKTHMKIICEGEAQRVVGIHMLGLDVDEILQGFAVAVKLGVTKKDLWNTMAIHPTSGEELVTM
jgi:glutathione reductase (NADPH)